MIKISKKIGLTSLIFVLSTFGLISNVEAVSFTATEVAAHNTTSDCYMILNGNVYNLTSFVNQHSGVSQELSLRKRTVLTKTKQ